MTAGSSPIANRLSLGTTKAAHTSNERVLILAPYPLGEAPSQRFRFEHYLNDFVIHGYRYTFQSFWTERGWKILYSRGKKLSKFRFLMLGFLRRLSLVFSTAGYDLVFIHREIAPVGPPFFEYLLARIFRKKIIYDFDDAIWLPNTSDTNRIIAGIKYPGKVKKICQWSKRVSVGNQYLASYAAQYNENVVISPTVVDTRHHHNQAKIHQQNTRPVIGWTGTHSTASYLKLLEHPLKWLRSEMDFEFVVISNQSPEMDFDGLRYIPWSKQSEIQQLLLFDVGVMPLEDSLWEQGKCGFKLIQYLSLGIPAVASPVGVNSQIIEHGKNGFLAASAEDWVGSLKALLQNPDLRNSMSQQGRHKVEKFYSAEANRGLFFSIFE